MADYLDQENSLAPDFDLEDTNGRTISLSSYRGRSHLVLVFNRGFR